MKFAIFFLALLARPEAPHYVATWTVAGDRVGSRTADDQQDGRVSCVAAVDSSEVIDRVPFLTLAFFTREGNGLHAVVSNFHGVGDYMISSQAPGLAAYYERSSLIECGRGTLRCYKGKSGCTVTVTEWTVDETVAGGRAGVGVGTIQCNSLSNGEKGNVQVSKGKFTCRAFDFTP